MNYYLVIILLIAFGGIFVSMWGWQVMQRSRCKKAWPTTSGVITKCDATSELDDLLPDIAFCYQVGEQKFERLFIFPEGTNPLPELTQSYMNKYPVDRAVKVFYNPGDPSDATLEPGMQGDWMILAMGVLMFGGALTALLFSNG